MIGHDLADDCDDRMVQCNRRRAMLIAGMVLFFATHMLPWLPPLRAAMIRGLGERAYQGAFALLSLAGFVMMIAGFGRAPFVPVYAPPPWGAHLALALMLPASVLLAAAYAPGNVRRFTRHPMLWGVTLWALAHLLANGDRAALLLFGGFGVYALLDMLSANLRGTQKSTAHVPWSRDAFNVIIGLVVYGGLLRLHPILFGVSPLH